MMDWSYNREFRTQIYNYSLSTPTTAEQLSTEILVNDVYYNKKDTLTENYLKIFKIIHIIFAKSNLYNLPNSYESLDASQTWLIYWNVRALRLLNFSIPDDLRSNIIRDIRKCQSQNGGFGGGPYQIPHMATTYASVMALVDLKCVEALEVIDREKLVGWLKEIHLDNGSFVMHKGGEVDVRGCYCAVTVAKAAGIYEDTLFDKTAEWIASCQTYEGGFGGAPGLEAHGGYSFCALAALILLNGVHLIDLDRLLHWAVKRQMSVEGGFQGRTNKLVDSCYTYWVGALFPLIQDSMKYLDATNSKETLNYQYQGHPLIDINALQEYVIVCCQRLNPPFHNPSGGGMIDKPGKSADPYHTCYALSGLCISQCYDRLLNRSSLGEQFNNELEVLDPIFNVSQDAMQFCNQFNVK